MQKRLAIRRGVKNLTKKNRRGGLTNPLASLKVNDYVIIKF